MFEQELYATQSQETRGIPYEQKLYSDPANRTEYRPEVS